MTERTEKLLWLQTVFIWRINAFKYADKSRGGGQRDNVDYMNPRMLSASCGMHQNTVMHVSTRTHGGLRSRAECLQKHSTVSWLQFTFVTG